MTITATQVQTLTSTNIKRTRRNRTPAFVLTVLTVLSAIAPISALAQSGPYPVLEATGGSSAWISVPASVPSSNCSSDPRTWKPADAALNAWLKDKADGSRILFPKSACYGYDNTLLLRDRKNLTIDGNGSTFQAVTLNKPGRGGWQIWGGSNIVLKNMTVVGYPLKAGHNHSYMLDPDGDGKKTSYEWQHAYSIRGTKRAMLDNVKGYNTFGDFVEIAHDNGLSCWTYWTADCTVAGAASDVIVRNSHFRNADRQGISIVVAQTITLQNNSLTNVARAGVDMEPADMKSMARNINLIGNTFSRIYFSPMVFNGPAAPDFGRNIYIADNIVQAEYGHSSCQPPVNIHPSESGSIVENVTIENNEFESFGAAIQLFKIKNAVIENNRAHATDFCYYLKTHPAIIAEKVSGLKILGNQALGYEIGLERRNGVTGLSMGKNMMK